MILSETSILRRIPAVVEPKTAMFIDGIRHAAEIIDFAYNRMTATLTEVALHMPESKELQGISTAVFLDAWAMVDAIDRFRMLYKQMPGISFGAPTLGVPTLQEVTKPFRDLRNVADHLAQRAEFVVSRGNGAALGILTWLTVFKVDPITSWFCTLRPGTLREQPAFRKEPIASIFDWPTSRVCLEAGGYEGNLSEVRTHIERRVRHLEGQLESEFSRLGIVDTPVANDVLLRQAYTFSPPAN